MTGPAWSFEWDLAKAAINQKKHHVSFEEAKTVFGDSNEISKWDEDHSVDEERYLSLGRSERGRLLVVSYTERGSHIRIISARVADMKEQRSYEQEP